MDCVITVKGNGAGRNGNFKTDQTRTIRDFIVDNTVVYPKVLGHLKDCDKCDPVEVLKAYLERRVREPKFKGMTSNGLVDLALKYERLFKKKRIQYDVELVNEFLWRSHSLDDHADRLGVRGIAKGFMLAIQDDARTAQRIVDFAKSPVVKYVGKLIMELKGVPDELEDLVKVAEVMLV